MDTQVPVVPSQPSFAGFPALVLLAIGFGALKLAAKYGDRHSTAFYLACICQLLAFVLIVSSFYIPPGDELNLPRILKGIGNGLAITCVFLSFTLIIQENIWVQAICWAVYVAVIIIIIYGYYKGVSAM